MGSSFQDILRMFGQSLLISISMSPMPLSLAVMSVFILHTPASTHTLQSSLIVVTP